MLFSLDALWEYQFVANALPADPELVMVPAADWLGPANAPFGTIGSFVTNLSVGTAWALSTGLWVRRALVVDGRAAVKLRGQVENACLVYLNGTFLGAVNPANVNVADAVDFEIIIPRSLLTAGTHTLAILALDETAGGGDTTWFWAEADYLPAVMGLWPKPPLAETIGWLNDVLIFEDGSEERERLRDDPRHTYRLNCFVPQGEIQTYRNKLYGARPRQWMVPVWSQIQHVGAVLADQFTIDALTSYSEYEPGTMLILWQSPSRWQVLGIEDVPDANTLTVNSKTEAFEDAWVAPVRKCYMETDPQRAFDGRNSRISATFTVEDNPQLTVAAPTQYLGNDIYFEAGLLNGDDTNETITDKIDLVDEQTGVVEYSSPWLNRRPARSHRMMGENPEEAWTIRQFLHRRAGRYVPFWQPSFEMDMRPTSTGALTNKIRIAADDYLRWASARDHIAVETTAGWTAHAITATDAISAAETELTLSPALNVNASTIKRVCFLGLRRLNADRVEISWIGGTACSCAVPVLDIEP